VTTDAGLAEELRVRYDGMAVQGQPIDCPHGTVGPAGITSPRDATGCVVRSHRWRPGFGDNAWDAAW
jgi:hypothetical protein